MGRDNVLPTLSWEESLAIVRESLSMGLAGVALCESLITRSRSFLHRFEGRTEPTMILDVTRIFNHGVKTGLVTQIGEELARRVAPFRPDLILTASSSGNVPAFATGQGLGGVDVVYATKGEPVTFNGSLVLRQEARSYTYGREIKLSASADCLVSGRRVLVVDDFLDTSETASVLAGLVREAGSSVAAMAFIIEKSASGGRQHLEELGYINEQIISLIDIEGMRVGEIKVKGFPFWFSLKMK